MHHAIKTSLPLIFSPSHLNVIKKRKILALNLFLTSIFSLYLVIIYLQCIFHHDCITSYSPYIKQTHGNYSSIHLSIVLTLLYLPTILITSSIKHINIFAFIIKSKQYAEPTQASLCGIDLLEIPVVFLQNHIQWSLKRRCYYIIQFHNF